MAKRIFSIICITVILVSVTNIVFADTLTDAMKNVKDAKIPGRLENMTSIILGIIQYIGYGISIITLSIIGIKYMTGSVSEKAEYKKTLTPILIGMIILFLASTFVGIVSKFTQQLF